MKRLGLILIFVAATAGVTWICVSTQEAKRYSYSLDLRRAQWKAEKQKLEAQLIAAQKIERQRVVVKEQVEVEKQINPQAIVESLQKLRANPSDPKSERRILFHLETLIDSGDKAFPAIRQFLSRNEDIDYESAVQPSLKGIKDGNIPTDFLFPPSLRFGLLDVARQIGGSEGEKLLADTLNTTGRGMEVAYLARALEQMSPGKYRNASVSVARDLLAHPASDLSAGPDKYDRNFLFGVLTFFKDASFAQQAQANLIRSDGFVDTGALKYLQTTLGEQTLDVIAQAYQDSRIVDPSKREPLARVALNFAGANEQANELYRAAVNDPGLLVDQKRELIEDLNQDGFENRRNPTLRDLELIKNRLDLIARYRNDVDNKIVTGAFKEAEKDLRNMLAKHANSLPR